MLKYLFSFQGHIGRIEFVINSIIAIIMYAIPLIIMELVPRPEADMVDTYKFFFKLISFVASIIILSAAIRRCRDVGYSPWWIIGLLIPFLNFGIIAMLIFSPGWGYKNGGSHLFSILKIIAECDGSVNSKEVLVFEEFSQQHMDEQISHIAKAQFTNGVTNPIFSFNYHLNHYIKANNTNPPDYRMVIGLLAAIAEADGSISDKETALMNLAATRFGLDQLLPPGFEDLLGMLAKLAKADGIIAKEEITVIDRFFQDAIQLNPDQREKAIEEFQKAKDSATSFSEFAKKFSQLHKNDPGLMELTFDLLVEVALADEIVAPEEESLLDEAAKILNIRQNNYNSNHRSEYTESSSGQKNEAYYAKILGLDSGYAMSDIKKRYRLLVAKNHPDKVANLSDMIRQVAENETKKIIEAYDFFKNKYE